jgi:hypothetical protein
MEEARKEGMRREYVRYIGTAAYSARSFQMSAHKMVNIKEH